MSQKVKDAVTLFRKTLFPKVSFSDATLIRGGARSEEILDASHVGSDQAVVIMWRKADTVKRVFAAALESGLSLRDHLPLGIGP